MFFSSIKEINKLLKEINRLLSKGMSNIYLKVSIEKWWRTQNFDFLSLKGSSPKPVSEELQLIEFSNFLLQFRNQRSGSKTVCVFSIIFMFKGILMF